jgi:hypothetical protein
VAYLFTQFLCVSLLLAGARAGVPARDPNATGQPLLEALAVNGQGFRASETAWSVPPTGEYPNSGTPMSDGPTALWFHGQPPIMSSLTLDIFAHYGNGLNTYQFVRSNPVNWIDPTGLQMGAAAGSVFAKWLSPVDMLIFASYFGGLTWANTWGGFGPPTAMGRLGLAWERFGFVPTTNLNSWAWWGATNFLPGTTATLARFGDLSILPNAFQATIAGINTLKRSFDSVIIGLGGVAIGGAAAYAGVLDAVMWSVEDDWGE